jgi:hypothetical protein
MANSGQAAISLMPLSVILMYFPPLVLFAGLQKSPIFPDTPSNIFPIESTEVYNLKQSKSLQRKWRRETKTAKRRA